MTYQWGRARPSQLTMFEPGDDHTAAGMLREDEVAVSSAEAILYGTRDQMLDMARTIIAKWGTSSEEDRLRRALERIAVGSEDMGDFPGMGGISEAARRALAGEDIATNPYVSRWADVDEDDVDEPEPERQPVDLKWESAGTDEPSDQNAVSGIAERAHWSLGPTHGGWWSVELIVRDADGDEIPAEGVGFPNYPSEQAAKDAADRYEFENQR